MADINGLEGFETLHQDLVALSDSRLPNVERLWLQLESRLEEFRRFLDKNPRKEPSRSSVATGKLRILDEEYAINEEFQQGALQLADALDLDEIEAAQLFLHAQDEATSTGRSAFECSILQFYQRRKYLLECIRLILQRSLDPDGPEALRETFGQVAALIVKEPHGTGNTSRFIQRCYSSMNDVRRTLQGLVDKINGASVMGQAQRPEFAETIEYQRVSLVQQHESLGLIIHYLVKARYCQVGDFENLLNILKRVDKYDNLLVHLFPAVAAFISQYGGLEGAANLQQARVLNDKLISRNERDPWALPYVHATVCAWWLGEYSGWYSDVNIGSPIPNTDLEEESRNRSKQFMESLKDGAFDFILSLSADVKSTEWYDPARFGLRQWLQRKAPALLPDTVPFSDSFQLVLMEHLETFVDAFISNMPDVLRKLRIDEDEQRQLSQTHEHDLDLERFLVIVSFAFEGRPDSAIGFWADPDSNLAGFLHWASRRASTPLVCAFCEMVQSISEDEECASAAHRFLLDEGATSSAKIRRTHSLTWNQIFKELSFFSSKIRDRPSLPQSNVYRPGKPNTDQAETEPESAMMLESYLRLITQLCRESDAARQFLMQHPTFNITELIFQLASSLIPSRLRGCAFNTLDSLLSHKTAETGTSIWNALESWMSGSYTPITNMTKSATTPQTSSRVMEGIFKQIGNGFEEPNAFVHLLCSLVVPSEDESALNDGLPFPEDLGAATRMPGIDPYIDFAVGHVFGFNTLEINDIVQLRLLRLTCLNFISICLGTFNENLVIFANQSNVGVDESIRSSNLAAYVREHPFSRVMEWLFNDRVIEALFGTIHQDMTEIGSASPTSPLILSILQAIEVITLVMDLQATYLDVVRPLIKLQQAHRRTPVANAAFASFEDAILSNLSIINDLGLLCTTGHPVLSNASLGLLEKLSNSPKLVSPTGPRLGSGFYSDRNKIIAVFEINNDAETVSRSLSGDIESNIDMEQGPEAPSYMIKIRVLDFLNTCLRTVPDRPTIAHLLLGFQCGTDSLSIENGSSFAGGTSLFHAVLNLLLILPVGDETSGVRLWLTSLKLKCLHVFRWLWVSPLSRRLVIEELRNNEAFAVLFVREAIIDIDTRFDERTLEDSELVASPSMSCLSSYLLQRSAILQYAAVELRQVSQSHSPSLKQHLLSTLQGSTILDDGQEIKTSTILDFFDFMELIPSQNLMTPQLRFFQDMDMRACMQNGDDEPPTYDISKVEQLLALRRNELARANPSMTAQDDQSIDIEAHNLLSFLAVENQVVEYAAARMSLLGSWVQVILVMIESEGLEGDNKLSFILQTLQLVLPKFETACYENLSEAKELARLARTLLFKFDYRSSVTFGGHTDNQASDILYDLFRISLRAIQSPLNDASFKMMLYGICYQYLASDLERSSEAGISRRDGTRTIKAAGDRLMDVICDDAYSGDENCRVYALMLLTSLVSMAKVEGSKYVIEALIRLNFIGVIIDSMRDHFLELQDLKKSDVEAWYSYYDAKFGLLLQICQTRFGAAAVLGNGLFHAIRESGLFSTDPDLRQDSSDTSSDTRFYALLAAILRVINAAVLCRGPENEQSIAEGRAFLSENRLSILSVFKKAARVGPVDVAPHSSVLDVAELFMLLITMTGFLDFEEEHFKPRGTSARAFT